MASILKHGGACLTGILAGDIYIYICNIYNMSGCVVSDIQTRAEGEWLYILYNTDANVVYSL